MKNLILGITLLTSLHSFAYNIGDNVKFLHVKIDETNKKVYENITITVEDYDAILQAFQLKIVTKAEARFGRSKTTKVWVAESKLDVNNWIDNENCLEARRINSTFLEIKDNSYAKVGGVGCQFSDKEVGKFGLFNPFIVGMESYKAYYHVNHQSNFLNLMRIDSNLESYIFIKP